MKRARASIRHQLRPSVYLEMGHGPVTQPYHTQPAPSTPIPGARNEKGPGVHPSSVTPKRIPRDGARACTSTLPHPTGAVNPYPRRLQ